MDKQYLHERDLLNLLRREILPKDPLGSEIFPPEQAKHCTIIPVLLDIHVYGLPYIFKKIKAE